jgi:hypothetical protein
MKLKLSLILLLIGGYAGQSSAQTANAWKTVTAGGYTYKYVTGDPTHSRFYTLKNGLRLY